MIVGWGLNRADTARLAARAEHTDRVDLHTRDLEQITDDMIAWAETGYTRDPLALPAVYASVRLIASTINQLPITIENGTPPDWLMRPRRYGAALDLNDLLQHIVVSMAVRGAAYLLVERVGDSWRLDALHAGSVQAKVSTSGVVRMTFVVDGEEMPEVPAVMEQWVSGRAYLLHVPYLVTPDHPEGLSPITAARLSVQGYLGVERQSSSLLDGGTYSGGRLETDQDLTQATALRYQETWVTNRKVGNLPVLGAGLRYVNDIINPADAQWLESRQYNNGQVAMMFGIPPDYLGMAMSGGSSSLSYANSQDNDRRFRRNCLAAFTQQISDAFSGLLPQGRGPLEGERLVFDYTRWEGDPSADDTGGVAVDDEGERGRNPDDRRDSGPVESEDHLRRDTGIIRTWGVPTRGGDGDTAALVPQPLRADRAHHVGEGHQDGPGDNGDRPADEPRQGRDHAPVRGLLVRSFGWVRSAGDQAGEGRGAVPDRPPPRTLIDPAARISAGDGDGNQGRGTDARDDR